ncbi:hypothetical protein IWW36_006088 [Coemansia brasiliensis]|uniref:Protein kinase domain-containing protein n=1 Tax=Coemansia brasiliensis TaxID=2650707 RepID=A0A9W8I6G4_9FUNG|nr:hypothetical protein IWW36_006088 [Coemansia brasiliensis]
MLNECGILHRDISTNNILAVSSNSSPNELHGLLIDLDSAVQTDDERKAPAVRSGTPLFMSIVNVEGLTEERTALDDWESLLYVICWLATFGITSDDRLIEIEKSEYPIVLWTTGTAKAAALAKRTHMDSSRNFETNIADNFQGRYTLLRKLATNLHKVLFLNEKCLGALRSTYTVKESTTKPTSRSKHSDSDSSDDSDLEEGTVSYVIDPLVERCKHVDNIVEELLGVMDSMKRKAKRYLKKMAAS